MVRVHMSAKKYELLHKYDCLINVRKEKTYRYYVFFLFFSHDYFVYKLVNLIMKAGNKQRAILIVKEALKYLKQVLGFQPFFFFKHIAFRMRQIFKINTRVIRSKITYSPVFLRAHHQVTYGVGHIIKSAHQLCRTENKPMSLSLCIIFLNCFISNTVHNEAVSTSDLQSKHASPTANVSLQDRTM
jgi:ribosomal protein S7